MLVLRFWLAVGSLLALAAAGCASSGGGDASGTGGEGGHGGSPRAPIGTYHFETDGPPGWPLMNLKIDPNGTFRWGFYSPEGGGNWRTLGDRLVLEPAAGKETFAWLVDFPGWGVYNFGEFERLEVVAGEVAGDIVVTGLGEQAFVGSSGQGPYDILQKWTPGGVCEIHGLCSGIEQCDEPPGLECDAYEPESYCPRVEGPPECSRREDCNDRNRCIEGTCASPAGTCEYAPVFCDDLNDCTTQAPCDADEGCAAGVPVADGTPCEGGLCNAGVCELASTSLPCTEQGVRSAVAMGGGPYTFDCDGPTTVVTTTQLRMETDVVLDGEGNLTLDGNDHHRVLWIEEGATAVLEGLTVTRGNALGEHRADPAGWGGGIVNFGTLALEDCRVSSNRSHGGGGIWNFGALTIAGSTVSRNRSSTSGGGIVNQGYGVLHMIDSAVSENQAGEDGGGVRYSGNGGGGILNLSATALIERSQISSNSGQSGGGILSTWDSSLTITDTTVSGNHASFSGGGIDNDGAMTMRNITVSGNTTDGYGAGIANSEDSTLTNSTVSGNRALGDCGPQVGVGGGISHSGGTLTLVGTTLSGNVATNGGSGIFARFHGQIVFSNTVVDGSCGLGEFAAELDWVSLDHNIESSGNTCGLDQANDQVGVAVENLNLGPLQANGGPTETHALGVGSVAIDLVPAGECLNAEGAPLESDQRGEPRDALCDVGAFEAQP